MSRRYEQTQEDTQMANKHIKFSTSFIIKKWKIKMQYLHMLIRITKIQKKKNMQCWKGCKILGTLINCR